MYHFAVILLHIFFIFCCCCCKNSFFRVPAEKRFGLASAFFVAAFISFYIWNSFREFNEIHFYILWRIINSIENVQCSMNAGNPHKKNQIRFTWISSLFIWFYIFIKRNKISFWKNFQFLCHIGWNDSSNSLCAVRMILNLIQSWSEFDWSMLIYTIKILELQCGVFNIYFHKLTKIEMGFWCAFIQLDIFCLIVWLIHNALCTLCVCVCSCITPRKNGINISIRLSKLK